MIKNRKKGFSLIEIAVVLVIIGIIMGMAVKGRSIIINSRVKADVASAIAIKSGFATYMERFSKMPGDASIPPARTIMIDQSPAAIQGLISADLITRDDFIIKTAPDSLTWTLLRCINTQTGFALDTVGTPLAANDLLGNICIATSTAGNPMLASSSTQISSHYARLSCVFDDQMDDGDYRTGSGRKINGNSSERAEEDCFANNLNIIATDTPYIIKVW